MGRTHRDDGNRYKTLHNRVMGYFDDFMAMWHGVYTDEQHEEISNALTEVSGGLAALQEMAGRQESLLVKEILREDIPNAMLVFKKYGMGIKVLEEVERDLNARLEELERNPSSEPDPPYR